MHKYLAKKLGEVHLIGVSHLVQRDRESGQTRKFITFLEEKISQSDFSLVAEEFPEKALAVKKMRTTTVQDLTTKLGKDHLFCDPDEDAREKWGCSQKNLRSKFGLKSAFEGTDEYKRRKVFEKNTVGPKEKDIGLKK